MCGLILLPYSHEVLVHCGMSYTNESPVAGSSRSLNRNVSSPTTSTHTDDPTFWVPSTSAALSHCNDTASGSLNLFENLATRNNYFFIIAHRLRAASKSHFSHQQQSLVCLIRQLNSNCSLWQACRFDNNKPSTLRQSGFDANKIRSYENWYVALSTSQFCGNSIL